SHPSISADNRTPAQRHRAEEVERLEREVAEGKAVPEALEAARIVYRNEGNVWGILWDTFLQTAPDILMGLAALKEGRSADRFGPGPSLQAIEKVEGSAPGQHNAAEADWGFTGAWRRPTSAQAERIYDEIRGADDVDAVARNTGMSVD